MKRKYAHLDRFSNALDNKQIEEVLEHLTNDCIFQAGNNEPVNGKEAIKSIFQSFFKSVKTTSHTVSDIFESGNSLVHRGAVTYTRFDNSKLTIPFCDVFKMEEDKIASYYIYIDWSAL